MFGHGNIDTPAQRADRDAAARAGFYIYIAHVGPEFLNHLQPGCRGKFRFADRQALADDTVGIADRGPKRICAAGHHEFSRVKSRVRRANAVYPPIEIRHVDMIVIGNGGIAFGVGVRIQNNLGGTDNDVVFRDDLRHTGCSGQGVNCSFRIRSSRLCSGSNSSENDLSSDARTVTRLMSRTSV